jgi:hypothetical protein
LNPRRDTPQHEAQRERRLQLDREQQVRQRALLDNVEELLFDFQDQPEQITAYIADLEAMGKLSPTAREALYWKVAESMGRDAAERILGRGQDRSTEASEAVASLQRERDDAHEAATLPHNVIDLDVVRAERTAALLRQLAGALGLSADDLTVRVDEEARRRTEGRGARGLQEGRTVFLNPNAYDPETRSGRALLGHEVAHVAQRADKNRAAIATGTHANKGAAEHEAAGVGAAFGAGQGISRTESILPAHDIAADTDASSDTGTAASGTRPSSYDIYLAGKKVSVSIPSTAGPTCTIPLNEAVINGVTLTEANFRFDASWKLQSGTVQADVALGEFVTISSVTLNIDMGNDDTARISSSVRGANLNLGEVVEGTIDLDISSEGMTGRASFDHSQVALHEGIVLEGGTIELSVDGEGTVSASGSLTGHVEGIGSVTVSADFLNTSIGGRIDIALDNPIELMEGVTIDSGSVGGNYSQDGLVVTGGVHLSVRDWVGVDLEGSVNVTTGSWTGSADLTQMNPYQIGEELHVKDATVGVTVTDGAVEILRAGATLSVPDWDLRVEGMYDIPTQEFSGDTTVTMTREGGLPLGETGILLTRAEATASLAANTFASATGSFEVDVPFQGEKTFVITGEDLTYDHESGQVAGTAEVTLARDMVLGSQDGVHGTIASGASASAIVEQSQLKEITAGLDYTVQEPDGHIGSGNLLFELDGETEQITSEATFTLETEYGFPDRVVGPVVIKEGAELKATIEGSFKQASLDKAEFFAFNPASDGTGELGGWMDGALVFDGMKLDVTAAAAITQDWSLPAEWGDVTLKEGGELYLEVKESELQFFEGTVPFEVTVPTELQPMNLAGELTGTYTKAEGTFTGTAEAHLAEAYDIPLRDGMDTLSILPDTSISAEMTGSEITQLGMNIHTQYLREGELWLEGHLEDGIYELGDKTVSGTGRLILKTEIRKTTDDGKWTFVVAPDTEVNATITKSELDTVGGTLNWVIYDGDGSGEPLLEGTLSEGELTIADMTFTGGIEVSTARDFEFPATSDKADPEAIPPAVQIVVKKGSGISGRVEANELASVGAELNYDVNLSEEPLGAGTLSGEWNLKEDLFTGKGSFALTRDFRIGSESTTKDGEIESWLLVVIQGSGVDIEFTNNALVKAHIAADAGLIHNETIVALGCISGDYKLGDTEEGFSGTIEATLTDRLDWAEGDRFHYWFEPETSFKATLAKSSVESAEGTFSMTAEEDNTPKVNVCLMTTYSKGQGLSGLGQVKVVNDILVASDGGEYQIYLAEGSGGDGAVFDNEVTELKGQLTLRIDKNQVPFAQGEFAAQYTVAEGDQASVTALGTIELLNEIDITPQGSERFTFNLAEGTGVGLQLTNSKLDWLEGTVRVLVGDATQGGDFLDTRVVGRYTAGDTPNLSATGTLDVIQRYDLDLNAAGYDFWLDEGGGATVSLQNFDLESLSAQVPVVMVNSAGIDEWLLVFSGTYAHAEKTFDGQASAELLLQLPAAEGVGPKGDYSFFIDPGTGIAVTLANTRLTEATGTLNTSVTDAESTFLEATGTATYRRDDAGGSLVEATGSLSVVRDKHLLDINGWAAWLEISSGATIKVTNDNIDEISGTIFTRLDNAQGPFVRLALAGIYTDAGGFEGLGMAELMQEVTVGTVGDYTCKVLPGTGAEVTLLNTDITHIGGTVNAQLDDASLGNQKFISIMATADYDYLGQVFNGTGAAEIHVDKKLAELGGQMFFLGAGSGAEVTVKDNNLATIGGTINLRLDDAEGKYLNVSLGGVLDASTGLFNGTGTTDCCREKKLAQLGDYSFWLAEGGGATAYIENNALTRVDGDVPFQVHDAEGVLLEGNAQGNFTTETKTFSGTGGVFLGRDLEFEISSSTKVLFKKGSGGEGTVKDNELRTLGGILECVLVVDGVPLVELIAAGEYDAVDNKLLWVEGTATMLQPFELLGGMIIVKEVSGTARIEDGKLVHAGGVGTIVIPSMNEMEGRFEVNWSNETGSDIYSGAGEIDFTLFDDPSTGRAMSGMVGAEYNEDDTFKLKGEVDYQINEILGGTIGVEVDQTLDPILSGTIEVTDVVLVDGRELFNMEIPILPKQSIPVFPGVNIDFGANAGLGLDLLPLTLSAAIGIENFRPLADNVTVPDFTAELGLNWGMSFFAAAAAYAGVSGGIPGANLGVGLEGEVKLSADLNINPYGTLRASGGKFGGELGIGVRLAPSLDLFARPYVQATLGKEFRHDLTEWQMPLGELFAFEWGTTYAWGDEGASESKSAAGDAPALPTPTQDTKAATNENSGGVQTSGKAGSDLKGGPQLGGGPETGSREGGGEANAMMEKIQQVQKIAEGVGAAASLIGELMQFIGAASFGPAGIVILLAWKLFKEGMSYFTRLKGDLNKVLASLSEIASIVQPYLPDWWSAIVKFFGDDPPSLWDALFGADDAMREAVSKGEHRYLDASGRAEMIDTMMSGVCGDADENAILDVLYYSESNGDLRSVVNRVDGQGDQIVWKLDGSQDTAVCNLFKRHGIDY